MSKDTEVTESLTLSTAKKFKEEKQKRENGELLKLPSGLVVKAKRMEITYMVKKHLFPSNLINLVMKLQSTGGTPRNEEEAAQMANVVDVIVEGSLLEPKITDEPNYDNNEMHIDDLNEQDKVFIYNWCQGGLEQAKSFRERQSSIGNVRPDLQDIPK